MQQKQNDLSQRVKEFLGISGEHSLFELLDLLRQFRNQSHPDKFKDDTCKSKAEDRFKSAQALIKEVEKETEEMHLSLNSAQLAIYKPTFDVTQVKTELDKAQIELNETQKRLELETAKTTELTRQLSEKKDLSLRADIEYLHQLYGSPKKSITSFGIAVFLSMAMGVFSQMETVSSFLERYSPVGTTPIQTALFLFMIFFLAHIFRVLWEQSYIHHKSEEVCSPQCAKDFILYLKTTKNVKNVDEFDESDVCDFLSNNSRYSRLLSFVGFRIYRRSTINLLKDIFIQNLLNKKLIGIYRASEMQRYFSIKSQSSWQFNYCSNE